MVKKTTLYLCFLIFAALLPAPVSGIDGLALGAGVYSALAITNGVGDYFTTMPQAAVGGSVFLDIPLFSSFSLGLALQVHDTLASPFSSGGWYYKSHWGTGFRTSIGYGILLPSSGPRDLQLGTSLGASFNYDRRTLTSLFFFYPGVYLEPFFEFSSLKPKKYSFTLILPIDYYFRKDLDFSGSIGLGILWRYYLKRKE